MSNMGVATKRRFLGLAFFPHGGDVSANLGLTGMSPDVEAMEARRIGNSYASIMENHERLDAVMKLADWFVEANEMVDEIGMPGAPRPPQELLVSFFMAAAHLIVDGGAKDV